MIKLKRYFFDQGQDTKSIIQFKLNEGTLVLQIVDVHVV